MKKKTHEPGERKRVKDKTHGLMKSKQVKTGIREKLQECGRKLERLNTYKTLFWLWLVLGIVYLATDSISRVTFFSVWILLLLEYAEDAWREENGRNGGR